MLKPSCWCMQSFLPLPYPFPWCLMPLSHPGGTFLVCPSLPVDFSPAPCGWVAVAQSVSAAMCKPCSASCAQGKLKSWGGTLRDSFAFQDFPGWQFDHFFTQFPSSASSTRLWRLGVRSRQSSPSFSMALKDGKNQHNAYFVPRYPHPSAVLESLLCPGFPNHGGGWAAPGLKPCLAMKCILKPSL